MKKTILICILIFSSLFIGVSCQNDSKKYENGKVYVYNAGEYIDPSIIDMFEKEYKIQVIYDVFENNEDMYPIVEIGSAHYDCICPSDYMIQKLIQNNLIQKIDTKKLSNYSNLKQESLNTATSFDENNEYAIPYMEGTVGILCNESLIEESKKNLPTSWADLWKDDYKNEILMQNSVRDGMMISLKKNGLSMNTNRKAEIDKATDDLIKQKPLVQAYVLDQVRDKMLSGESLLGVIYSGELLYINNEANDEYEYKYVIPKEGTNKWMDAWVMPRDSENVDNAYLWLDFLLREDIAKMNAEYITYETCNERAYESLKDMYDVINNMTIDFSKNNNEVYEYLGTEVEEYYNDSWKKVKAN